LNACTRGTWSVNPETGLVDVRGNFDCQTRRLKTLLGISFGQVSWNFFCHSNQLTSLEGAPQTVGVDFLCGNNQLTSLEGAPQTVGRGFYCDSFAIDPGEWNPSGWEEILTIGEPAAQKLMKTLPYLDPAYWLELHRSNRKKFNDIWVGYRQDPEVRKTALFQEVEAALSGRALKNLEDLQDLKDFGL